MGVPLTSINLSNDINRASPIKRMFEILLRCTWWSILWRYYRWVSRRACRLLFTKTSVIKCKYTKPDNRGITCKYYIRPFLYKPTQIIYIEIFTLQYNKHKWTLLYFITVSCRGMCNFIVAQSPINITKHKKSIDSPHPLAKNNPIDKLPSHPPILLAPFIIPVAVDRISTGKR